MESVPKKSDIDLLVSVVGRGDEFIAGEDRYLFQTTEEIGSRLL